MKKKKKLEEEKTLKMEKRIKSIDKNHRSEFDISEYLCLDEPQWKSEGYSSPKSESPFSSYHEE